MAPKPIVWLEMLLLSLLLALHFGRGDIFVDERGETEVIQIDEKLALIQNESFGQNSKLGVIYHRAKREGLGVEDEEEGSGDPYEDEKEEEEYEDDYDDSDPILTSTPKPASGMIPPSSTTSPLWSTSDLSRSTVIPTTEMSSTLKANDLEIESSSTPFDENLGSEDGVFNMTSEPNLGLSSEPPSTLTSFPDLTEKSDNQAPYVKVKLPKYEVIAGKPFRKQVPENTFGDEDGNTRNLKLKLKDENGDVVNNNWIGLDENNQVIYALLENENQIGKYEFKIEATDDGGLSVEENLDISVRQYQGSRIVSHQLSIEFAFTNNSSWFTKDWPWTMVDKISEFYRGPKSNLNNHDEIIVRGLSVEPFIFSWTNDTLTRSDCPKDAIRSLYSKLVQSDTLEHSRTMKGTPSRLLKTVLGPQIIPKSVTLSYHGSCLNDASLSPPDPEIITKDAFKPIIRNPIDRINVTAGELLRLKVPEDTCWDEEDGTTPKLRLQLLTTVRRELSPNAWLKFDSKNQEFVGIPLEEEVGREEYQLVCSDSNGLIAIDAIVVMVQNRPFSERFGIEFSLTFKDFPEPKRDIKVRIVESLANYFGDPSTSNIILKSFDYEESKIVWYNKSLAYVSCDDSVTKWVSNQMLMHDGKIRQRFVQHFENYLDLLSVEAVKKGSCANAASLTPTSGSPSNEGEDYKGSKRTIFHGILPSADYLLTFIIPAVIITCMLLLAILLACLLHKKRKAGKLSLFYSESLPPRVPVILQDELYEEEEQQGFHKQPILLPEDSCRGMYAPYQLHEMDRLLSEQVNPDFNSASSLSRPTPAYQRTDF